MGSKNIFVTGASSGIGWQTALKLAQMGHRVLVAARRADQLRQRVAESATVVGEMLVAELDVQDPASIARLMNQHKDFFEKLDVLVNNAGLALGTEKLFESNFADIETVMRTNVIGLLEVTRKCLPAMVARKSGLVVNLGSIAGETPYGGGAVYCASKAAVHMITDCLRIDLGGTGVRVSTVAPGRVETEFSNVRFRGDQDKAAKVYQGLRPLSAADIADTIAWIVSQPGHVNIQEVVIMPTDQPTATTLAPLMAT